VSSIVDRIFTSALGDIQLSCMPDLCLCLWGLVSPKTPFLFCTYYSIKNHTLKYFAVLFRTVPLGSRQIVWTRVLMCALWYMARRWSWVMVTKTLAKPNQAHFYAHNYGIGIHNPVD
jgi:hypothetical protein